MPVAANATAVAPVLANRLGTAVTCGMTANDATLCIVALVISFDGVVTVPAVACVKYCTSNEQSKSEPALPSPSLTHASQSFVQLALGVSLAPVPGGAKVPPACRSSTNRSTPVVTTFGLSARPFPVCTLSNGEPVLTAPRMRQENAAQKANPSV